MAQPAEDPEQIESPRNASPNAAGSIDRLSDCCIWSRENQDCFQTMKTLNNQNSLPPEFRANWEFTELQDDPERQDTDWDAPDEDQSSEDAAAANEENIKDDKSDEKINEDTDTEHLDFSPFGPNRREQVQALKADPQRKDMVEAVLRLYDSKVPNEIAAGARLLDMLSSSDAGALPVAQSLLKMIGNKDERQPALTILNGVENHIHAQKMLEIMSNPEHKTASGKMLEMLGSENKAAGAVDLLRILDSKFPDERKDAEQLLKMLNSKDAGDYKNATNILVNTRDLGRRHHILSALANTDTRTGAENFLQMLNAPTKNEQHAGHELLALVDHESPKKADTANNIFKLLGGDAQQQQFAKRMLSLDRKDGTFAGFDIQNLQAELVTLYSSKEHGQAARQLASWLDGKPDERTAVRNVFLTKHESNLVKTDSTEGRFYRTASYEGLLNLIGDPDQKDNARLMLTELGHPLLIRPMQDMLSNEKLKPRAEQLLKMLGSTDQAEKNFAREAAAIAGLNPSYRFYASGILRRDFNYPQEFISSRPGSDAAKLLQMLSKEGDQAVAKELISQKSLDLESRHTLLTFYEEDKTSASRALAFLKDPIVGHLGPELLKNVENIAEFSKMHDFLLDSRHKETTKCLAAVPDGAVKLLKMLVSSNESESNAGGQLLKMLADPNQVGDARDILSTREQPAQLAILSKLLCDPKNSVAGRILIDHLHAEEPSDNSSASALLEMVSTTGEKSGAAQQIVSMLADPSQRDTAIALISNINGDNLERMGRALADTKERAGAQELIRLLSSPEEEVKKTVNQFIGLLANESIENPVAEPGPAPAPASRPANISAPQEARKLLTMLGNSEERDLARSMILALGTGRAFEEPSGDYQRFFNLTSASSEQTAQQKEAGKQLLKMMRSPNDKERSGVNTLIIMLGEKDAGSQASGSEILAMLGDPKSQEEARTLLAKVSGRELRDLLTALNKPELAPARETVTELLQSDKKTENQSINILTDMLNQYSRDGQKELASNALSMMSQPNTREAARQAVVLASEFSAGRERPEKFYDLLKNSDYHKDILQLSKMLKDTEQSQTARTIIEGCGSHQEIHQMLALLNDPQHKETSRLMMAMLNDEDRDVVPLRILTLLSSTDESTRKAGEKFLEMLGRPDQRDEAEHLVSMLATDSIRHYIEISNRPTMKHLEQPVKDMLGNDEDRAKKLLPYLNSPKPDERQLGERLLLMYSDQHYRQTAIRKLDSLPEKK